MKIRNGFVSNSSSSSFILLLRHKPANLEDLKNLVFCDDTDSKYAPPSIFLDDASTVPTEDAAQLIADGSKDTGYLITAENREHIVNFLQDQILRGTVVDHTLLIDMPPRIYGGTYTEQQQNVKDEENWAHNKACYLFEALSKYHMGKYLYLTKIDDYTVLGDFLQHRYRWSGLLYVLKISEH